MYTMQSQVLIRRRLSPIGQENTDEQDSSQRSQTADYRPVRVVDEWLSDDSFAGDGHAAERIERDARDKRSDRPCQEYKWQGHYDASPLYRFISIRLI